MILLTTFSKEYEPLHLLSSPPKEAYAKRWGMKYVPLNTPPGFTCWHRPMVWLQALLSGEELFFMGADAAITNPAISPEALFTPDVDLVVSPDGNGINSDVMMMRPTAGMVDVLRRTVLDGPGHFDNDQDAMATFLSRHSRYSDLKACLHPLSFDAKPCGPELLLGLEREYELGPVKVHLIDQRLFNAYPFRLYGKSVEEHSWHPGDFIIHCPGLSMEQRIWAIKDALKRSTEK